MGFIGFSPEREDKGKLASFLKVFVMEARLSESLS
jgi:hypothetical protein